MLWPDCGRILTESEQRRAKVIKCTQITFEWISLRNSFPPERSRCTELKWVRPSKKIKIDNCIDLVTGLTSNPDCRRIQIRVIYFIFWLQSLWVISYDSIHSESFIPAADVFNEILSVCRQCSRFHFVRITRSTDQTFQSWSSRPDTSKYELSRVNFIIIKSKPWNMYDRL